MIDTTDRDWLRGSARYFEYYGNQAETVEGRSIPLSQDYFDFTVYEPFEVSAQIIPWNHPIEMTAQSLQLDDGVSLPEFGNNMGAMVSDAQRDRAETMVAAAVAEGADLVCDGL